MVMKLLLKLHILLCGENKNKKSVEWLNASVIVTCAEQYL